VDLSALAPLAGSLAASLLRAGLPTLGTIASAAAPFPFNLFVRPAMAAITAALGVDPAAPDAEAQVQAKVDADPAAAAAKLQAIEDDHKVAVDAANRELELRLSDVQNARSTEGEYVKAGSFIAAVPGIWTLVVVLSFVGVLSVLLLHPISLTETTGALLNLLLGVLVGEVARCGSFWLGSSQSSRLRADQAIDFAHKSSPDPASTRRK
jgi:hypothetical protein